MNYYYLYNGSGVAVGDINNDGLTDIFFGGIMTPNRLYLNKGNFQFEDISLKAGILGGQGIKTGVTMVDINQDGFLDLYVCKSALEDPVYRRNELFINNGNLTFTEKAAEYGVDDPGYASQAYFFDMENDGDPDLFLVNHRFDIGQSHELSLTYGPSGKLELVKSKDPTYQTNRLYVNEKGKFVDKTASAGLLSDAFGLSATLMDINQDNLTDIYVCNDFLSSDLVYINNGNGTFSERFDDFFAHSSFSSMGSDCADINNDGCLDMMTVDMVPEDNYRKKMLAMDQNFTKFRTMQDVGLKTQFSINAIQLNNCNGRFSNVSHLTGTAFTDWSWGVLMNDYNNDTQTDIFIANGFYRDVTNNDYRAFAVDSLQKEYNKGNLTLVNWLNQVPSTKIKSYFYRNNGNLNFTKVSDFWNSGREDISNASATADFDNDGYLDIIVNNLNACPYILKNNGKGKLKNHAIRVKVKDGFKAVDQTVLKLYLDDGSVLTRVVNPTRGYMSCSEDIVHFGIGAVQTISKLEILWKDGSLQTVANLKTDTLNVISRSQGNEKQTTLADKSQFRVLPLSQIRHQENDYIDFKREPLLHQKYSEEGPAAAVADVNGDGLTDLYLGGSAGSTGSLWIQTKENLFRQEIPADFLRDKFYEDNAATFFDSDGDGDQDLYVASGGNEYAADDTLYQHRLYINNGKGVFTRNKAALPSFRQSGGVVVAHDIDNDGDQDIFAGGRVTPGRCPEPPSSYFLRNDRGVFKDVTAQWGSGLQKAGMVTDAAFADLNKDGKAELIVCGEWMPVMIWEWSGSAFADKSQQWGTSSMKGWWYTLKVADLNQDGFPEILAGNLGLNSQIKASTLKPASMWYKDFDGNGTVDPVLCYYNGDKSYPLHNRDRLLDQMIFLKKKFTRYTSYANATIRDIFTEKQMEGAVELTANTFSHALFSNEGGKAMAWHPLPVETQVSVVKSFEVGDLNGDGTLEILTAGNFYGTDAQFGRYDASIGTLLQVKDKKNTLSAIPVRTSGVNLSGNVRHVLPIGKQSWIVLRNNDAASLLTLAR
jgi:hypothetical protein